MIPSRVISSILSVCSSSIIICLFVFLPGVLVPTCGDASAFFVGLVLGVVGVFSTFEDTFGVGFGDTFGVGFGDTFGVFGVFGDATDFFTGVFFVSLVLGVVGGEVRLSSTGDLVLNI
jgi:hypothetical protein